MSSKTSITCDHCSKELIYDSQYPHHYALHLSAKDHKTQSGGYEYAVFMKPPLDSPKDFCNVECLVSWAKKTYPARFKE